MATEADSRKANYREALRESSTFNRGLLTSFLLVMIYIFLTVIRTTDAQILYPASNLTLPIVDIELPFDMFFQVAPLIIIAFHFYLLFNLSKHAGLLYEFYKYDVDLSDLPLFIFNHIIEDTIERHKEGKQASLLSRFGFLKLIGWLMINALPLTILFCIQIKYAKAHAPWVTFWHFTAMLIDVSIIGRFWYDIIVGGFNIRTKRSLLEKLSGTWISLLTSLLIVLASLGLFLVVMSIMSLDENQYHGVADYRKYIPHLDLRDETLVASPPSDQIVQRYLAMSGDEGKQSPAAPPMGGGQGRGIRAKDLAWREFSVGLDLQGRDLRFADFSNSRLINADLRGAQLQGANLSKAQLLGANLAGAHLQAADLSEANLEGAILREAHLQIANLIRTTLDMALMDHAQLQGADLVSASLIGASISWAQMQGAFLWRADLRGAQLQETNLQGADLQDAQLQGAVLQDAQLQGVSLARAQLHGADLRGAQLQGAYLDRTGLRAVDFDNARLDGIFGCDIKWQEPEDLRKSLNDLVKTIPQEFIGTVHRMNGAIDRIGGLDNTLKMKDLELQYAIEAVSEVRQKIEHIERWIDEYIVNFDDVSQQVISSQENRIQSIWTGIVEVERIIAEAKARAEERPFREDRQRAFAVLKRVAEAQDRFNALLDLLKVEIRIIRTINLLNKLQDRIEEFDRYVGRFAENVKPKGITERQEQKILKQAKQVSDQSEQILTWLTSNDAANEDIMEQLNEVVKMPEKTEEYLELSVPRADPVQTIKADTKKMSESLRDIKIKMRGEDHLKAQLKELKSILHAFIEPLKEEWMNLCSEQKSKLEVFIGKTMTSTQDLDGLLQALQHSKLFTDEAQKEGLRDAIIQSKSRIRSFENAMCIDINRLIEERKKIALSNTYTTKAMLRQYVRDDETHESIKRAIKDYLSQNRPELLSEIQR